jgi:DNA invertase Pin-like site-specific DNA recombinase
MRTAIYTRVSTVDKQDTENQLAQLKEFCVRSGWEIAGVYDDHASAKTGDRDSFKQLFLDASQRKFDMVLFWALDRFSREGVYKTLMYLNELTSYGVGYRSFTEQYLDSCGIFKDAVISILATVAKQERVRISERVKAGIDRARANGKKLGRGLSLDDAAIVRAGELRGHGVSLRNIAAEFGVSHQTIRNVLEGRK